MKSEEEKCKCKCEILVVSELLLDTFVTIMQYRSGLGWPTIGRGAWPTCAVAHIPWPVMANDRGGRKVAKVTFPGRRVTNIRRGDRLGAVCLRRSSEHDVLKIYVSLLSYIANCRNYEYYTVCDISMCCGMDLSMYSNVYEDCIMNPRGDKC